MYDLTDASDSLLDGEIEAKNGSDSQHSSTLDRQVLYKMIRVTSSIEFDYVSVNSRIN